MHDYIEQLICSHTIVVVKSYILPNDFATIKVDKLSFKKITSSLRSHQIFVLLCLSGNHLHAIIPQWKIQFILKLSKHELKEIKNLLKEKET